MKLSMLSPDELPREKLRANGPGTLSNADLLAIILRTGTGNKNVLEVARDLLSANGNRLGSIAALTSEELCRYNGIGKDKAASLSAVFELVKRIMAEEPDRTVPVIYNSKTAFLCMEPKLKGLDHEECWLMYLNRNLKLIGTEKLTSGTPINTGADVQMIVTKALGRKASKLIIIHNHPEGDPTPGEQDIEFTLVLKSALQTVRLLLLDHIVIGDSGFFSFSDENIVRAKRSVYNKKNNRSETHNEDE